MSDIAIDAADVKSNTRGWTYYAEHINSIWKKGAGDFIQCGQLLIDAKAELANDAFHALIKTKRAFDRTVGTKLMAIAANPILCAHVHSLPPCWSSMYELSQLDDKTLESRFADGTISPRMLRKDALALKPKKKSTTSNTDSNSKTTSELAAAWNSATKDQRQHFLDKLGRAGLCGAMSEKLKTEFEDVVTRATIAGASENAPFAIYATDKLHCALRCAEAPDQDENRRTMVGALGCIIKKAKTKNITRSQIVIAERKARRK
jgi:hypothetical protein